jgi:hypothetical protein
MVMNIRWHHAALLAAALLVAEPAQAFRCGSRIVSKGDHSSKVRRYCGEPLGVQERLIYRSGITRPRWRLEGPPGSATMDREVIAYRESYVEVLVEEWTYNLGPHRLMRLVRFENGFVTEIHPLGYGYHK